jgi:ElaB/YqjD/DUF883 family membrane-anchored ribosome-binding protein
MPASANEPEFNELDRIVAQAEELLKQLGDETGDAAEAVRERVTQTLHQAKARLAATVVEAEQMVDTMAERTDKYVRANPWQAVAIAALLGGALTLLVARISRK